MPTTERRCGINDTLYFLSEEQVRPGCSVWVGQSPDVFQRFCIGEVARGQATAVRRCLGRPTHRPYTNQPTHRWCTAVDLDNLHATVNNLDPVSIIPLPRRRWRHSAELYTARKSRSIGAPPNNNSSIRRNVCHMPYRPILHRVSFVPHQSRTSCAPNLCPLGRL